MSEKLLEINNLSIHYFADKMVFKAVNGVNLSLERGQTVGLVGETGAGKTTTALGIMGLIPSPPGKVVSGEILFEGKNLLKMSAKEMRKVRGKKISMIFQDPMTALNPVLTVGDQITEVIKLHEKCSTLEAAAKAKEMLEMVGIPAERFSDYPHQFSGGMKQRVVISIALACRPEVIIADEPTTALDVTIQAQVMELMTKLKKEIQTSMILITHDLGVVAEICDKVCVMYAGKMVEQGPVDDIFYNPSHPYTVGLLRSMPRVDAESHERLIPIEGTPVDMLNPPEGCPFAPRCEHTMKICLKKMPPYVEIGKDHRSACWLRVQDQLEREKTGTGEVESHE